MLKRARQLLPETLEVSLDSAGTADQHMVGAGDALHRQEFAGERAQSALHPVADHRSADFPGDGETDADRRIAIGAVADQQNEVGGRRPPARIGGEEIGAFANGD